MLIINKSNFFQNVTRQTRGKKTFFELQNSENVICKKTIKIQPLTLPTSNKTLGIIPTQFIAALDHKYIETFVLETKQWRVWGNQGAVITKDNYVFDDVSREFSNKKHSIFNQLKIVKPSVVKGNYAVIAMSGSNIYYHWMFDLIPRINLLKDAGVFNKIDFYIINYSGALFQNELLKKIGVDQKKLLITNDHWNCHYELEKLFIPSLPSPNDYPSIDSCQYLRKLFKDEISNRKQFRKIYIKRKNSRTIINESTFLPHLIADGFQVVVLEEMLVREQALLFSEADVVVGAHGAGFTNIVFCKPKTSIIEIFSPLWINPCYWIISNHLGLSYQYIIGKNYTKETKENKSASIYFDPTELFDCLNYFHEN